jgi:hypothetical protein
MPSKGARASGGVKSREKSRFSRQQREGIPGRTSWKLPKPGAAAEMDLKKGTKGPGISIDSRGNVQTKFVRNKFWEGEKAVKYCWPRRVWT